MIQNVKSILNTLLTSTSAVTSLVPASNILAGWPDTIPSLPLIAFRILDSYTGQTSYFDNQPIADEVAVQIDIWGNPEQSLSSIFDAVNTTMELALWNRVTMTELVEESDRTHIVAKYETVLYR